MKSEDKALLIQTPDVTGRMGIQITDWGDVIRLDINQLGAVMPDDLRSAGSDRAGLQEKWSSDQVDAMLEAMEKAAAELGGDFRSFAEWTVMYEHLYSPSMRPKRKKKFGEDYLAAISSLKWLNRESGLIGYIQASAYIPRKKDGCFKQVMWRPKCMPPFDRMYVVAPAVTTYLESLRLLHVAGMTGIDAEGRMQYEDDPGRQIQFILENIISVFEEAGGSRDDVVRLRPYAQTPQIASIIRSKVSELWKGHIEPAVFMADGMRHGGPDDKMYAEIQVFGILPGSMPVKHVKCNAAFELIDGEALVARTAGDGIFEFLQASEIRPGKNSTASTEALQVVKGIEELLLKTGFQVDEVCSILVYTGTLPAYFQMMEAVKAGRLKANTVHVIPSPEMFDMQGRQIKAEVTACRLVKNREKT